MSTQFFDGLPYEVTSAYTYLGLNDPANPAQLDTNGTFEVRPPWRGNAEVLVLYASCNGSPIYFGPSLLQGNLSNKNLGMQIGAVRGMAFQTTATAVVAPAPAWVPVTEPWVLQIIDGTVNKQFLVCVQWRRPLFDPATILAARRAAAGLDDLMAQQARHKEEVNQWEKTEERAQFPLPWTMARNRNPAAANHGQTETQKANQLAPGVPNLRRSVLRGGVPRSGGRG